MVMARRFKRGVSTCPGFAPHRLQRVPEPFRRFRIALGVNPLTNRAAGDYRSYGGAAGKLTHADFSGQLPTLVT
jgi:hypothetical protein